MRLLASALAAGGDTTPARRLLAATAEDCDPHTVGAGDWQVQALVVLLRSPLVDVLEAAGATPGEARATLPDL